MSKTEKYIGVVYFLILSGLFAWGSLLLSMQEGLPSFARVCFHFISIIFLGIFVGISMGGMLLALKDFRGGK
jgi:hypothetical protein